MFKKLKKLIKSLLRKELDDKKIVAAPGKRNKNRKKNSADKSPSPAKNSNGKNPAKKKKSEKLFT